MEKTFNNYTFSKIIFLIFTVILFRSVIFPYYSWKEDEFFYMTAAKIINAGGLPYQDFADIKSPGIFYIYSFIDFLGGDNFQNDFFVLKIVNICCVFSISVFFWLITKELFNKKAGFLAALLFASYSTCVRASEVLAANTEVFVVFFTSISMYFFVRKKMELSWSNLLLSSLFLSFAFLINMRIGILVIPYVVIVALSNNTSIKKVLKIITSAVFFLLPPLMVLLYYKLNNSLDDLLLWQYSFSGYYVGAYSLFKRIARGILVLRFLVGLVPILIFGCYYLISKRKKLREKENLFLLLVFLFTYLSAFSGGKHVERYYYLTFLSIIPICAAGLSIFIDNINIIFNKTVNKKIIYCFIVVLLSFPPFLHLHFNIMHHPPTWTEYMNNKNNVIEYIKSNTSKDDKIFVWPFGGAYYFASDRLLANPVYDPSGHLLGNNYLRTRESADLVYNYFFEKFNDNPPVLIIDKTEYFDSDGRIVNEYIQNNLDKFHKIIEMNYIPVKVVNNCKIYKRKDGN